MSKDNPKPTAYDQAITMYEKSANTAEGFCSAFWLIAVIGIILFFIGATEASDGFIIQGLYVTIISSMSAFACSGLHKFIGATMFKFMHENQETITTVNVEPDTRARNSLGVLDEYDRI